MKLEIFHCGPVSGTSTHAPILFVHGAYCGAWMWAERFMPYFAEQGFVCHAVSLRGHGGSEGVLTWATLNDYVDDVEAAAARLDSPPIIIGHSMGGLITQHFLGRGNAARAAVLLATVPPSGLGSSAMHLSMFSADLLWQLGLLQSLGPEAVSPEAIHRAFFSKETQPSEVQHLLPRLQRESQRASAEMLSPSQPTLPSPSLPILVMAGDADIFLPLSAARETATFYKAELEVLNGAPHGLMLDSAWWQPSADKIIAWINKIGA
jgi:pimeloyl-ACP methyl ester carboxylesterase